jgi:adenylate cyclase
MDDDIAQRVYSDPVARWFVTEAYRITDTASSSPQRASSWCCRASRSTASPTSSSALHRSSRQSLPFWARGRGSFESGTRPHGDNQDAEYRDNPMRRFLEQHTDGARGLGPESSASPAPFASSRTRGATDYVALPLLFTTGHVDALSVVSRPSGRLLEHRPRPHVPAAVRLHRARSRTHLPCATPRRPPASTAYCRRRRPGQRIPGPGRGQARRRPDHRAGDLVLRPARLHPRFRQLPRDTIIALLNDYFDAMGTIVTNAGGEILKFMGDGMLAIFPMPSRPSAPRPRRRRRAPQLGGRRDAGAEPHPRRPRRAAVRFGLALHLGEVMFGNIGASQRLDFTVIGPAVNYAARLEKLCGRSTRRAAIGGDGRATARRARSLGDTAMKDIDRPQAIYTVRT